MDTVVDDVSDDDKRERERALTFLDASPVLRQAAELLRHFGDRVKIFPVSAFGTNRERILPPKDGPSPRLLHGPLLWAASRPMQCC